jgi:hypothetical protein
MLPSIRRVKTMAATKQTANSKGKRTGKAKEIAGAVNRAKPGQKNQPPKRDNNKGKNTNQEQPPGEARELENVTSLEEIAEPIESTTTAGASQQNAPGAEAIDREQVTAEQGNQPADSSQQAEQPHQPGQPHHQIAQIARTGAAVTMQQGEEQKRGSINDLRHPKKQAMLKAIEVSGGSITAAAEAAGCSTDSHYIWLKNDPLYAELYEVYHHRSTQTLITEAIRRATEGQQEPILYQGKQVIGENGKPLYKTFKSDNLIMFLLKQRDPTFRDNYIHNVGIWGKSGQVNLVFNIPRPAGESITGRREQGEVIDVEPEPVAQTKG